MGKKVIILEAYASPGGINLQQRSMAFNLAKFEIGKTMLML
jgi:hypothetical protein